MLIARSRTLQLGNHPPTLRTRLQFHQLIFVYGLCNDVLIFLPSSGTPCMKHNVKNAKQSYTIPGSSILHKVYVSYLFEIIWKKKTYFWYLVTLFLSHLIQLIQVLRDSNKKRYTEIWDYISPLMPTLQHS